jgi:hypothetical protein
MMPKVAAKKRIRREWRQIEIKELKRHSKNKTPVKTICRALNRTPAALRQKAMALGIPLGHRRSKKK